MDERDAAAAEPGTSPTGCDDTTRPVTPLTQELRIATVMTGGVSLAIWMGGVARELNLLEQASRARISGTAAAGPGASPSERVRSCYGELLELLDLTVDADVLSGTSAGGINAAFLGYARANDASLDGLRDVWLNIAAFEKLLRDPTDTDLPSLLQGDGVLLSGVDTAIGRITPAGSATGPRSTDVFITTTLLTGEAGRFTDANGTVVQDVDNHGVFRFDGEQLAASNGRRALALAARSSASFPGAFEPSFVPYDHAPASDTRGFHPAMEEYTNVTRDHWAADGGLLMNQPIRPLLQTIFDRPASRQVRRVLMYVVPTTGPSPDPRADPPAEVFDRPLSLAGALVKDLGAALHQSISADLQAIRDHNDRVDSLWDTRLRLAELAVRLGGAPRAAPASGDGDGGDGDRLLTAELLGDYRARQSTALVRPLLTAFLRRITTMPAAAMPPDWRAAFAPGANAEELCRDAAATAVADTWPDAPPAPGDDDAIARFGLTAFEGAQGIVITMLRRAFVLARNEDDHAALAAAVDAVHVPLPGGRPRLDAIVGEELSPGTAGPHASLVDAVRGAALRYASAMGGPPAPGGGPDPLHVALPVAWRALAKVVVDNLGLFGRLLAATPATPAAGGRAMRRETRDERRSRTRPELETYVRYLGGDGSDAATADVDGVAMRLLDLHVATRAVLPVAAEVEQPVELVQVSADTRSALAPGRATAARKLTGLQFHHFGAFYKSSWRANDWMWGRVDGAGWLVSLLLDPRRIVAVADARCPDGARAGADEWFYGRLVAVVGREPGGEPVSAPGDVPAVRLTPEAVRAELRFLRDDGAGIPASLPVTSLWVALGLQRLIAAEELPVVASEILANPSPHRSTWATELLDLVGHPPTAVDAAVVAERLRTCPVPDETLAGQVGEPLFTRTATKALAVTTGAVTTSAKPLAGFRPVLATLRTVTLGGYRATALTKGWPRRLMILGVVLLAVGIVAALQGDTIVGVAGMTIALAGAYTITVATFDIGRRLVFPIVSVTIVALLIAPVFPVVRRSLFGTSDTDLGVFGRDVVPWLRSPFWHVLIVAGGIIVLATLIGLLPRVLHRGSHAR